MFLIDDILLSPVSGLMWLGRQVQGAAEAELYDETRLTQELFDLQERELAGQIGPEEYEREEERLMNRLAMARRRKTDGSDR